VLQLRESIRTQLRRGVRQIVLDMSAVTSVDSSALGELVSSYTSVRSNGGILEVVGLNDGPNYLVQKFGLEPVLSGSSVAPPRRRKTLYRNIGIALTVVLAAAFYWVLTR